MLDKNSTIVLKLAVVFMGLVVLALCVFGLPNMLAGGPVEFPAAGYVFLPMVIGMYAAAIPFYIALWQTLKLIRYIDRGIAFSDHSVRALEVIKRCALVVGALYLGGVPLLFPIAQADDAPGLILIGFSFACMPIVVAVFAATLRRLVQSALDMKAENDLTV